MPLPSSLQNNRHNPKFDSQTGWFDTEQERGCGAVCAVGLFCESDTLNLDEALNLLWAVFSYSKISN